ncbi:MAG: radical SAM peptide maturase [Odoribacter sp.]|nr:radical SAM peptide maturase [Odoribacter sp.]
MKNNILFSTPDRFSYWYSISNKEYILLPPLARKIIMLLESGIKTEDIWKQKELERETKADILYYLHKIEYLKNQHFWSEEPETETTFGQLTAKMIQQQLENLKVLTFEVTDKCNLNCKYCTYGQVYQGHDERQGKNLDFSIARNMLDYLFLLWKNFSAHRPQRTISIGFYGGEPLMNFELIQQIIRYISSQTLENIDFTYNMTTNAVLLDKYSDFLVRHDFKLLISLDGADEDNCHRVSHTGKSSFAQVYQNIKNLQRRYPDYFKNNVSFNSVFHSGSKIERIVDFFKTEFDKPTSLSELNNANIADVEKYKNLHQGVYGSIALSDRGADIDRKLMYGSPRINLLTYFLHHTTSETYSNYRTMLYGTKRYKLLPSGSCIPFERKMYITVNGKILVCERIGHHYTVGRVDKQGVTLSFQEIADRYNQYYRRLSRLCEKCYMQTTCSQCMFYLNLEENPLICYHYSNEQKFAEYLSFNISYLEMNPWAYEKIMKEIIIF